MSRKESNTNQAARLASKTDWRVIASSRQKSDLPKFRPSDILYKSSFGWHCYETVTQRRSLPPFHCSKWRRDWAGKSSKFNFSIGKVNIYMHHRHWYKSLMFKQCSRLGVVFSVIYREYLCQNTQFNNLGLNYGPNFRCQYNTKGVLFISKTSTNIYQTHVM